MKQCPICGHRTEDDTCPVCGSATVILKNDPQEKAQRTIQYQRFDPSKTPGTVAGNHTAPAAGSGSGNSAPAQQAGPERNETAAAQAQPQAPQMPTAPAATQPQAPVQQPAPGITPAQPQAPQRPATPEAPVTPKTPAAPEAPAAPATANRPVHQTNTEEYRPTTLPRRSQKYRQKYAAYGAADPVPPTAPKQPEVPAQTETPAPQSEMAAISQAPHGQEQAPAMPTKPEAPDLQAEKAPARPEVPAPANPEAPVRPTAPANPEAPVQPAAPASPEAPVQPPAPAAPSPQTPVSQTPDEPDDLPDEFDELLMTDVTAAEDSDPALDEASENTGNAPAQVTETMETQAEHNTDAQEEIPLKVADDAESAPTENSDNAPAEASEDNTNESAETPLTDVSELPKDDDHTEQHDPSRDTLRQDKMEFRNQTGRRYAQMHAERAARRWQQEAENEPYAIVKDTCYYTALDDENTVRGNFSKKRYKDDVLPQTEPVAYEESEWYQGFETAEDPWGDYVEPGKKKQGVSHKTWFVILWLIIFWPVGLILMWARKKFPLAVRIIITVIIAAGLAGEVFFLSQYGTELYNDMMNENGTNITAQTPDQDSNAQSSSDSSASSQQKALDRAKEYLNNLPLSHDGMITQLEYDGYSTTDATYAADHCGADWNQQAAKMAEQALATNSYTRDSMIQKLKSDGFTEDQAAYGADAAGLK